MQPCSVDEQDISKYNQLKPLKPSENIDIALTDLVGDLAAYEPGRKAIIFEGGGDTDFDQTITLKLFPELNRTINLVSGTNKHRVKALHEVLNRAYDRGDLKTQFFAIIDKDFGAEADFEAKGVRRFTWDVYHIENYLLVPSIIANVMNSFSTISTYTEESILEKLKVAARSTVDGALRHKVTEFISVAMIKSIDLKGNPTAEDYCGELMAAATRSLTRINDLPSSTLNETAVREYDAKVRAEIESSFADGSWLSTLPGRNILKAFGNELPKGISYDTFRNMVVNRMAEQGHKPAGMKAIIDQIIAA
jgi:hypothetical protein